MSEHIVDKVIVITGAASGFGRLVSQKAAALGAQVVCADINQAELVVTENTIKAAGGVATSLVTDVTQFEQMQALANHALG